MNISSSYKRTSVCGMTYARGEKQDKRLYYRCYRRACKRALHADQGRKLMPSLREHSNAGCMAKDGRMWFDLEAP